MLRKIKEFTNARHPAATASLAVVDDSLPTPRSMSRRRGNAEWWQNSKLSGRLALSFLVGLCLVMMLHFFLFTSPSINIALLSHHRRLGRLDSVSKDVVPLTRPPSLLHHDVFCDDEDDKTASSTRYAHGLPSPMGPVDSYLVMMFDLTDDELAQEEEETLRRMSSGGGGGASHLARQVVYEAATNYPLAEQPAASNTTTSTTHKKKKQEATVNMSSPYFTFFASRNATLYVPKIRFRKSHADDDGNGNAGWCEGLEKMTLDIVYSHVDSDSASFQKMKKELCVSQPQRPPSSSSTTSSSSSNAPDSFFSSFILPFACGEHRFRNWGELKYSLRSVFAQMGVASTKEDQNNEMKHKKGKISSLSPSPSASPSSLLGTVHIMVADEDQTPSWLNTSHERIRVVPHRRIFPLGNSSSADVSKLNSHAIESVMHRIPNLSRFFVYFNNDMFWGRPLSVFDYFRPMSIEREEHRLDSTSLGQCVRHHVTRHLFKKERLATPSKRRRYVLMEPIVYAESAEGEAPPLVHAETTNTVLQPNAQQVKDDDKTKKKKAMKWGTPIECSRTASNEFTNISRVATLVLAVPHPDDVQHALLNYNKRLLFERYHVIPQHTFAHIPSLMDRHLLQRLLEVEAADIAETTRKSRLRGSIMLWTTYVYPHVALAHRRAVDLPLAVARHVFKKYSVSSVQPLNATAADSVSMINLEGPSVDSLQGSIVVVSSPPPIVSPPPSPLREDDDRLALKLASWRRRLTDAIFPLYANAECMYHFCLIGSLVSIARCEKEIKSSSSSSGHHGGGGKLFVTINDDMPATFPSTQLGMEYLMKSIVRHARRAPWELTER